MSFNIGLNDGKLLILNDKLKLVEDSDSDCCCGQDGQCSTQCRSGFKLRRHCDTPPPEGYDPIENPGPFSTHWRYNTCNRLLVYENIEICNTRIRNVSFTPDYILKTNGEASNGGPFYVDYENPVDLLDTQPYWWSDCAVGGWETGTVALEPTKDNIHDTWDCCRPMAGGAGSPTTILNGLYRIYVLMTFKRSYIKGGVKNPESTSAAFLIWVKISYIGTIEDCEEEEIIRGDCPNTNYPPDC